MPGPNYVLDKGFYIDAATSQFKAQKVASTSALEHVTEAGSGEACVGVVQETVSADDVTSGRIANVRLLGITRAIASGAVGIGARVRCTGSGKLGALAATTAKQEVVGIAMTQATTDGDHFDVLLTPGAQADT